VECGVLQSSVLGLLFFLLYVNDMAKATGELGFVLFADDTKLFGQDCFVRTRLGCLRG
jgi:hypothetical protein